MKKINELLTIAIFLFTLVGTVKSQSFSISVETDTAYCHQLQIPGQTISYMKNNTNDTLHLDIIRTSFENSPPWLNGMCIHLACHYSLVDSVRTSIPPMEEILFKSGFLCFEPTSTIAKAVFKFRNVDVNDDIQYLTTYGVFIQQTTSTQDEFMNENITLFPNPAQNNIYINTSYEIKEFTILDLVGRIVKNAPLVSTSINITDLPKGIYFIKFLTPKGFAIKEFIKNE